MSGAGASFSVRGHVHALLAGGAGGLVFYLLGMPLAWMLGSMLAVTALSLSGFRPQVHFSARGVMIGVLGVFLGSAFSPQVADRIPEWSAALAVLAAYVVAGSGLVYLYLRTVGKFDPVTAYFSSTPGGLGEMVVSAEALGGDARRVSLVHTTRIITIVLIIPFWFRLVMDVHVPSLMPPAPGVIPHLRDWLILAACAGIGWPLAKLCRIPAAGLVGPMVLSAAAHLAGLTAVQPPPFLVAVAQLVIGASVGARFAGTPLKFVWQTMRLAIVSTFVLLALALLITLGVSDLIDVRPEAMALVLAPGGLAEMSLIALALGVDTAFVSSMHICRIAMIVILGPSLYRMFGRGSGKGSLTPRD